MAASVLNSKQAVAMSVYVVRAFVQMREQLAANQEILKRLAEIDRILLQHDAGLREIYRKLLPLLQPSGHSDILGRCDRSGSQVSLAYSHRCKRLDRKSVV